MHTKEPVAAWVQHRGARLSAGHDPGRDTLKYFSRTLLEAAERLSDGGRLSDERRVIWSPIETAHANAARNHGLALVKGKYIRFLDDDYFYPDAACKQLEDLIAKGADLSFANIESVDSEARDKKILEQLDTSDWCAAVLSPTHSTATNCIVYRSNIVEGLIWDVSINKNQDVYWAMLLCVLRDFKSIRFDGVVAAWVQHKLPRVSQGHHANKTAKETVFHIFKLVDSLSNRNLLTEERANCAADYLWSCIHRGMMYEPFYWLNISRRTEKIGPLKRSATSIHKLPVVKNINPAVVELSIVPWRWIKKVFGMGGL